MVSGKASREKNRKMSQDRVQGGLSEGRAPKLEGSAWWGQGLEGRVRHCTHRPGSDLGRGPWGCRDHLRLGSQSGPSDLPGQGVGEPAAGITTNDESSYFITYKDEEAVGGGTEPPGYLKAKAGQQRERRLRKAGAMAGNRSVLFIVYVG